MILDAKTNSKNKKTVSEETRQSFFMEKLKTVITGNIYIENKNQTPERETEETI